MKAKLVSESLNEISSDLFKSALKKTKEYDQHNRGYYMGTTFFRDFLGKPLFNGKIIDIGTYVTDVDSESVIQISTEVPVDDENINSEKRTKKKHIVYVIDRDQYDGFEEVSRQDARILSLIAQKVNPETKYKNINKEFKVDYPIRES